MLLRASESKQRLPTACLAATHPQQEIHLCTDTAQPACPNVTEQHAPEMLRDAAPDTWECSEFLAAFRVPAVGGRPASASCSPSRQTSCSTGHPVSPPPVPGQLGQQELNGTWVPCRLPRRVLAVQWKRGLRSHAPLRSLRQEEVVTVPAYFLGNKACTGTNLCFFSLLV